MEIEEAIEDATKWLPLGMFKGHAEPVIQALLTEVERLRVEVTHLRNALAVFEPYA